MTETETEQHGTFFGIPVTGEITRAGRDEVPQRPMAELGPYISAVLGRPEVLSFRWKQYTPYFNDGDPCVFGVHGVEARLEGMAEDAGDYGDGYEDVHYGDSITNWQASPRGPAKGVDRPTWDALNELYSAIESGAFDRALLTQFGDHATVTVGRDSAEIEFYEHD